MNKELLERILFTPATSIFGKALRYHLPDDTIVNVEMNDKEFLVSFFQKSASSVEYTISFENNDAEYYFFASQFLKNYKTIENDVLNIMCNKFKEDDELYKVREVAAIN